MKYHNRLEQNRRIERIVPVGRTELLMGVHPKGATRDYSVNKGDVVEAALTVERSALDVYGRPDPAITAVIMDHALASAIRANPQQLGPLATTQLHFDIVRPFPPVGTTLHARAHAPAVSESGSFATAVLVDDQGTEYASSSGWFIEVAGDNSDELDKFLDRAEQDIDYDEYSSLAKTLRFKDVSDNDFDAPTAFRGETVFGEVTEMLNENGTMHGGALTMMGIVAAQRLMSDSEHYLLQSVQVNFLKGAVGAIRCKTRARHLGCRFRSVEVHLETDQGIVATVSCGFRSR